MALQDRISQNWSEAIRGVSPYTAAAGRAVEHSVVSDHVCETKYGDSAGVFGTLPEVPSDWTELNRKKNIRDVPYASVHQTGVFPRIGDEAADFFLDL